MPMSLQEQVRLLSVVDILGPLSAEELEDLAKNVLDTYLEQGDVLYTPRTVLSIRSGCSSSSRGGCRSTT